jgi:hypothetical protein
MTQARRCAGFSAFGQTFESLLDAGVISANGRAMPKADDDETMDTARTSEGKHGRAASASVAGLLDSA